jgi:proteasome lid subunit RPN8/RPN11
MGLLFACEGVKPSDTSSVFEVVEVWHPAGLREFYPLTRKRAQRHSQKRKTLRHRVRKKTVAQLLTEINRKVRVLEKRQTASSVYGKKLHLILHPYVVKGNLDSIDLSRSTGASVCIPHDVLDRLLREAEVSPKKETIGVMLGFVERDVVTVSDSIPGEPRSSAYAELSAEELSRLLDRGKLRNPDARFVGWYHSHLGHGIVPSKTDLKTQSVLQQFSPSIFALIVNPKSEELEAYVTEAFSPVVSEQAPKDSVVFRLPLVERAKDEKRASPCTKCGKPLTWIEKYDRWYCYTCQKYE